MDAPARRMATAMALATLLGLEGCLAAAAAGGVGAVAGAAAGVTGAAVKVTGAAMGAGARAVAGRRAKPGERKRNDRDR